MIIIQVCPFVKLPPMGNKAALTCLSSNSLISSVSIVTCIEGSFLTISEILMSYDNPKHL